MTPADYEARDAAATDLDTTFFVEAAAGTGKTTSLVARILNVVTHGRARLFEVVAITFTEKAAGELKMRLREELEKNLRGEPLRVALGDLERAQITTIHSFCAGLLRERPIEAAVDPQFAVADELQKELLLAEAWSAWLAGQMAVNPPALRAALMREVRLDALEALAVQLVEQRTRLDGRAWPVAVPLDVPGTLARLHAAVPALERSLTHCTEPASNPAQAARTLLDALPLLDHASPERVTAVLSAVELKQPKAKAQFDSPEAFREFKDTVKTLQAMLEEFAAAAGHNFLLATVAWLRGFVAHFQELKRQQALLDFDDLLVKTRDLLRDRADILTEFRGRIRFLLVDEFQDTDPVQAEMVLLLGSDRPGKLFIVGDPKQSIYSFRGADIEMYANTHRAVETKGRTLVFSQNFRSRSTIVKWVNAVFKTILTKSTDGDYQPGYVPLMSAPALAATEPRVTLLRPRTWDTDANADALRRAEAAAIAGYLQRHVAAGAFKWGDVALLFRSFTAVDLFADTLQEHGVPYRVIGGKSYYQRQEIQTLISLLCSLDNPNDKLHLVAVLRSPLFGWPDELIFLTAAGKGLNYLRPVAGNEAGQVAETYAVLRRLHEARHATSVARYVAAVFDATKICEAFYASQPDGSQCVANLLKALEQARALEAAGLHTVRGFVRRLRQTLLGGMDEEPSPANEDTDDVVRLLSVHKSKGLQFPVVVLADLAGASADSGPQLITNRAAATCELRFAGCRTQAFDVATEERDKRAVAEEIRLLYVAATRAQERLVIPWFKEKGERLSLLRAGFEPVASELVEVDFGVRRLVAAMEKNGKAPTSRRTPKELVTKREAWLAEREALLKAAAVPLVRTSPSKLAGEAEPSEEEPTGIVREQAMELGVIVHEALQRMDAGGLSGEALTMVERALKSELLARAGKADEVYRELPFCVGTMEGKIDLLFREGRRWVLVDYKTDAAVESERYTAQLQAYRTALREVAGIEVDELLLFFLRSGTVKQVRA